jgi:hypothetical protein
VAYYLGDVVLSTGSYIFELNCDAQSVDEIHHNRDTFYELNRPVFMQKTPWPDLFAQFEFQLLALSCDERPYQVFSLLLVRGGWSQSGNSVQVLINF